MAKEALKEKVKKRQKGRDGLTKRERLPKEPRLYDTHRLVPRCKGGLYTDGNTVVALPENHMKEHRIWLKREPELEELKCLWDARRKLLQQRVAVDNRVLAHKRKTDILTEEELDALKAMSATFNRLLKPREKDLVRYIRKMKSIHAQVMRSHIGIGEMTIAACLTYLNPYRAESASAYIAYAGYHRPSHKRLQKNIAGGGNKALRTQLYVWATVQLKMRGGMSKINKKTGKQQAVALSPYLQDYERRKRVTEKSELITETRITGKNGIFKKPWKDVAPGHRNMDAMRYMIKLFLAHLWVVQRTLEGLPIRDPYVLAKLGHTNIISPEDRGWQV